MIDRAFFDDFLLANGLSTATERAIYRPLTGGVSSDIYRVELPGRTLCLKRALRKLKVAADWEAPVSRNLFEWEWISFVAEVYPQNVPVPIAHDSHAGIFAMSFISAENHPVWKSQLLQGDVRPATARAVGRIMGLIHAASTRRAALPERFDSGDNFYALRLEPYLLATAQKHPDIAPELHRLATRTAATKLVLVHGDVSPKNILVGDGGPVFLDAECAWFGDPAFDLAFCLNHLMLKRLFVSNRTAELRASFDALRESYLAEVTWESVETLEQRAASLLPALLLARVDGKSPVEYVTSEHQRNEVRAFAVPMIRAPLPSLVQVADRWF